MASPFMRSIRHERQGPDSFCAARGVSGVDSDSENITGVVEYASAGSTAYQSGQLDGFKLIRIPGTPPDAGIVANDGSGEGEGEGSQLVGEGEGFASPPVPPVAPTIAAVRTSEGQGNSDSNSGGSSLRNLLASNTADDSQQPGTMSDEAIDAAMESVLPQIQLGLSSVKTHLPS